MFIVFNRISAKMLAVHRIFAVFLFIVIVCLSRIAAEISFQQSRFNAVGLMLCCSATGMLYIDGLISNIQ